MPIETRETTGPAPVSGAAAFLRWLDANLARRLEAASREGCGAAYLASLEAAASKIMTGCASVAVRGRIAPPGRAAVRGRAAPLGQPAPGE